MPRVKTAQNALKCILRGVAVLGYKKATAAGAEAKENRPQTEAVSGFI